MKPIGYNNVAIAILELELLGYRFTLEENKIRFICEGNRPALPLVQPYLDTIRANREHAVTYLRNRAQPFDLAAYLLEASDKIAQLARAAEAKGDLKLARSEWKRYARFCSAYTEVVGIEPNGDGTWQDWIETCETEKGKPNA